MPACIAPSGLLSINNQTQGGAWRLTPPRLPWADMLRPFGAEQETVFPYCLRNLCQHSHSLPEITERKINERRIGPSKANTILPSLIFFSPIFLSSIFLS
jgi:hypothetical protein